MPVPVAREMGMLGESERRHQQRQVTSPQGEEARPTLSFPDEQSRQARDQDHIRQERRIGGMERNQRVVEGRQIEGQPRFPDIVAPDVERLRQPRADPEGLQPDAVIPNADWLDPSQ